MTISKTQIIENIIDNEVLMNCSMMVDRFMKQDLAFDNSASFSELHFDCLEKLDYPEDEDEDDPEIIEVFEHYFVSDWLARKLADIEAPVSMDVLGCYNIWGRTETGQSLTMDSALNEVAEMLINS